MAISLQKKGTPVSVHAEADGGDAAVAARGCIKPLAAALIMAPHVNACCNIACMHACKMHHERGLEGEMTIVHIGGRGIGGG